MPWVYRYEARARRELERLDRQTAARITEYIEQRILPLPDPTVIGKALKGNLSGYWRYRVGDYRIVCQIHNKELLILVIYVGHRKDVFKDC